jgi:glycerol-3-phosphate acyltransferase PlsY
VALATGVLIAVVAYLIGAVPSGLIVGRVVAGLDVRQYGSGKMGATNVARTVGWGPALVVLLADVLKGVVAILLGRVLAGPALDMPIADAIAGSAALIGHNWPVYIGFRGGRGVATGVGTLFAVAPAIATAGALFGVLVILATDVVSIGSIVATSAAVVLLLAAVAHGALPDGYVMYALAGGALIIARHADNIARALRGQERRIGVRPKVIAALRGLLVGRRPRDARPSGPDGGAC